MKAWLRRWWADTLFKRLFLLLWGALVVSHLVAFAVATGWPLHLNEGSGRMPTFPSLPPGGLPAPGAAPPGHVGPRGPAPPLGNGMLVVDYGVRLLLIGLAAWWGARWLSAPTRRLVHASRRLGAAVGRPGAELPRLDERRGTLEVREAARVFNEMAQQLDESFRHRGLLMAAISHDLRTPLTRMRMRLEALGGDDRVQRCVADIAEMDALIDSALEVFRGLGTPEPAQATDITALVQSLCDDALEQGQPVAFKGDAATAPAQPMALRRIVANLLSNALRYGERARVAVRLAGDSVVVTVDDDGRAFRRKSCRRCSRPSTAWKRHATAPPAAPAWACTSPATWRSARAPR